MDCDVLIIGAGLSGLAAGIRLAHFNKLVCVVERHRQIGGLNSFYTRQGITYDTGLHAVTNYVAPGDRTAPLNKLLRQLRLQRADLEPCEQTFSSIRFPTAELRLTNRAADLEAEVGRCFPADLEAFRALAAEVRRLDVYTLNAPPTSALPMLRQLVTNDLLRHMLLCPLMFYGNAAEEDMEMNQFCIMFRSLFLEGMWRPRQGMHHILAVLRSRYEDSGGRFRLGCGVRSLGLDAAGRVSTVELDDGSVLKPGAVLSCGGYVETLRLCQPEPPAAREHPVGRISIVEALFTLDRPVAELGFLPCIQFLNRADRFTFACPQELVDYRSAVVCAPTNFQGNVDIGCRGQIRLTHLASFAAWSALDRQAYRSAKQEVLARMREEVEGLVPGVSACVLAADLFTPMTIHRYTGRLNGALYGSPVKRRAGTTPIPNLYVCGTDQGFLGIIGAMLSGVSIANAYLLK